MSEKSHRSEPSARVRPGPPAPPAPVLVVDDEVDLAETCQRLLRRLGCSVERAATRAEALALLAAHPIALLITDVQLADGNGLDVVRAAREQPMPPPVIVVTGFASHASRAAARAAGATAYLPKPFSTPELTALTQALLAPSARPRG